jgi:hypothetical protein
MAHLRDDRGRVQLVSSQDRIVASFGAEVGDVEREVQQVFDVKQDFGARLTGLTDDTLRVQEALDACVLAGGGIVYFPPGICLCNTRQSTFEILRILGSNVQLRGAGPASVIKTTNAPGGGYGVLIGINYANTQLIVSQTVYTMSGSPAKGAMSVTLATAAQAGNFAADDYILVRTGQTIDPGTGQPDSEINQVVSADAGTGIIVLRYPLCKPYAQEYYVSGVAGRTTTSVTANLAPFGISKITSLLVENIGIRDLKLVSTGAGNWGLDGGGIVGFDVENVIWEGNNAGICEAGLRKFARIRNNRARAYGAAGGLIYHLNTGWGDSDVLFDGNFASVEDGLSQLHIHEGASRTRAVNNWLISKQGTGGNDIISIRGRAYDADVSHNYIIGSDVSVPIKVDSFCDGGGIIDGNHIYNFNNNDLINIDSAVAAKWIVGQNYYNAGGAVGTVVGSPTIYSGTGTPEGVVAAPIGSLFMRRDGGAGTSIYVKQSGVGNTGWVGK